MNSTDKKKPEKIAYMLVKLFPKWEELKPEQIPEAIEKACDFLDCGRKYDDSVKPKLVDWEQDAEIIVPAVNKSAGREIRENPNIHWWTFFGWYMNIEGGIFATVLRIRSKIAKNEKLENWEKKFVSDNSDLIILKNPDTDAIRQEKEDIKAWLGGG